MVKWCVFWVNIILCYRTIPYFEPDTLKSTLHRVRAPPNDEMGMIRERFSIPYVSLLHTIVFLVLIPISSCLLTDIFWLTAFQAVGVRIVLRSMSLWQQGHILTCGLVLRIDGWSILASNDYLLVYSVLTSHIVQYYPSSKYRTCDMCHSDVEEILSIGHWVRRNNTIFVL
jgi:hypothetical protein